VFSIVLLNLYIAGHRARCADCIVYLKWIIMVTDLADMHVAVGKYNTVNITKG